MRKISLILFLVLILVVPGAIAQSSPEISPYEVLVDSSYSGAEQTIVVTLPEPGAMYRISGSGVDRTGLYVREIAMPTGAPPVGCPSGFVDLVTNSYTYIASQPVGDEVATYLCVHFDIYSNGPANGSWSIKVEKVYSPSGNLFGAGSYLAGTYIKIQMNLSAGETVSSNILYRYPRLPGNTSSIPEPDTALPDTWFSPCLDIRLKNTSNWSSNCTPTATSSGIYEIRLKQSGFNVARGPGLVQITTSGSGSQVDCSKIYSKKSSHADRFYEIWLEGNYTGAVGFLYDNPDDLIVTSRVTIRETANGPNTHKSLPASVSIPAPYFYVGDRGAGVLFFNSMSDPTQPFQFILEICSPELAPIPTPSPTPPTTCLELSGDYSKTPVTLEIPAAYQNWIVTILLTTFPVYYDKDGLTYEEGQFFRVREGGGTLTSNSTFSVYLCTSVQPSPTPTPTLCTYLTSEFTNGLHRIQNSKLVFFVGYYAKISYASATVELYAAGVVRTMSANGAHLVYADSYATSTQQFQLAFCGERVNFTPIPTGTPTPTGTITPTPTGTITVTVTVTETPTPTGTVTPGTAVPTPTRGYPDGIPTPTWCPPWLLTPSPVGVYGVIPDFSIPWPSQNTGITTTVEITFTMHITPVLTAQAMLLTPIAQAEQISNAFTPESAEQFSEAATGYMSPALAWLSILNPSNSAWSAVGGPLWALSPVLLPLLPILVISLLLAIGNMLMFIFNWLLKLFDVIIKLIELIPGE